MSSSLSFFKTREIFPNFRRSGNSPIFMRWLKCFAKIGLNTGEHFLITDIGISLDFPFWSSLMIFEISFSVHTVHGSRRHKIIEMVIRREGDFFVKL